ncbi:hypothetical protein DSM106972_097120 [Dulcicalothrix desertica PCC 7102]|uniref:Uncharacterized protein n=1 Tax=Dulcicalothrix desertica PCC 7102 TaxID=232991 RepID=A0A3S1C0J9_9CYAN|nr:hypothetical protein [Dulcicalothrix desertica]RUS93160.1 hypothetical protein DSM106972_097120 [Dulcicalothrix desertica PCC 7102]TWH62850.1 hypothetical protein CAL7102_00389 [Dulcicalothrix desertica PCC 7102]
MTENNEHSDGIKRSKGKFDPVTEKRDWSIAASEEYCKRIARNTGKRLIEIIDTEEDSLLPIVCIFEGYLDD